MKKKMIIFSIFICFSLASCGSSVQESRSAAETRPEIETQHETERQSEKPTQDIEGNNATEDGSDDVFNAPAEQLPAIEEISATNTQVFDELVQIGYTEENAREIERILKTIGVDSFVVDNTTGADSPNQGLFSVVGYPNGYTDENRRCFFTTEDGIIFYAALGSEDLYDTERGGFLMNYSDVHVPETNVSSEVGNELQQLAEAAVKSSLNYPESADFVALDWGFGREDDRYMVLGTVTAQNGFGTEESIRFTVWFVEQNGTFEVQGVALNGTRIR